MLVKTDIPYCSNAQPLNHSRQKLDVIIPNITSDNKQRVIVFVHGGSWTFGSKERIQSHLENLAKHTNSIVVAPNYQLTRLSKDEGFYIVIIIIALIFLLYCIYLYQARKKNGWVLNTFVFSVFVFALILTYVFHNNVAYHKHKHPAHINDVAQAFKWTHDNIDKYQGDKDNIFIAGHSAGGHIASLLSTNPIYLNRAGLKGNPNDYIKGCVSISGVYTDKRMQNDFLSKFVLRRIFGDYKSYVDAFPIYHVDKNSTPPFLLVNANQDGLLKRHTLDMFYTLKQNHVYAKYHLAKTKHHMNIHWFNPTKNLQDDEEDICDDAKLLEQINQFIAEVEEYCASKS